MIASLRRSSGSTGRCIAWLRHHRALFAITAVFAVAGCASNPSPDGTAVKSAPASTLTSSAASTGQPLASVSTRETAWPAGGANGRELITPNHRVRTTVTNPVIIARLPDFLEDALLHYRTALVGLPLPKAPMDSYVMGTRLEWARLTAEQVHPRRAEHYLRIERGGFADNGVGFYFDIGTQDTFAVAAHEGWHQYTQTTFQDVLPSWLDEGCATYCEGFRWSTAQNNRAVFLPWANIERYDRLRDAHRVGSLMSLGELLDAHPHQLLAGSADTTLDYYAQLWALIHFLHEGEGGRYAQGLAELLRDCGEGRSAAKLRAMSSQPQGVTTDNRGTRRFFQAHLPRSGRTLFEAYIDQDIRRVDAEYRSFVDQVVAPGGKQAIAAGRSPLKSPLKSQ